MYDMNDQKMGYLTQIYKSISSFETYRYFAGRRIEKAFLYLFFMTLILGTLSLVKPIYSYNTGIKELFTAYQSNVPDFELKNGELNVKSSEPIIFNEDNGIIIIDTTGKTDDKALDKYDNGMLILKDRIIQKENGFVESPVNFSDLEALTLTKASLEKWLPLFKWINLFIIVFGLIWFYIAKLFSILIVSVIAVIVCGISRFNINYKTILKLSFYAITLPVVVKIIVRAVGVDVPFFGVLYYSLGTVYVWMAAKLLSRREEAVDTIE